MSLFPKPSETWVPLLLLCKKTKDEAFNIDNQKLTAASERHRQIQASVPMFHTGISDPESEASFGHISSHLGHSQDKRATHHFPLVISHMIKHQLGVVKCPRIVEWHRSQTKDF